MRIALVADIVHAASTVADDELTRAPQGQPLSTQAQFAQAQFAQALRDAGQQVTEHVLGQHCLAADDNARAAVPGLAAALRAAWARRRPDVAHATGYACGLAAIAVGRELDVPVVVSFGSLIVTERRHGMTPDLERARLERAIGLSASAIVAASAEEAADLVRMGVRRGRVHMIPVGIDTGRFAPEGLAAAGTAAAGSGPGSAGTRPSGTRPGSARSSSKARLVTVADPDPEHAATLARAAGAVPGAELIGCPASDDGELVTLLRSADVFVHVPAHEPSGVACLRAMACGVPVVASATGAHLDMVIDGTTGLLVPPGRPDLLAARIRRLLATPMLRQGLSMAAADRAQSRYSWERIAAETTAVYDQALAASPAAA